MKIVDTKTIKEIQETFNQKFPFLKVEFYKESHAVKKGSPNSAKWAVDKTIGEIRSIHNSGDLNIHPDQKVSTLESNFLKDYGLNVQVFYQSGNLWLQTASTDDWTLKVQNERAESFMKFLEERK